MCRYIRLHYIGIPSDLLSICTNIVCKTNNILIINYYLHYKYTNNKFYYLAY